MPKIDAEHLTEQQQKWFASVRGGLERETGKSLDAWVAIAKTCPETAHRARLQWFKTAHGLMQNRASYVLSEAFPPETGWDTPETLRDALWTDPSARAIYLAVEATILTLPKVVVGQRKGYSAWSNAYQFAALRPVKGGARLGLALAPDDDPKLQPAKASEGWSERLKASLGLSAPGDVDDKLKALMRKAWEAS